MTGTITKRPGAFPDSLLNHPEIRTALLEQIAQGVPGTVALKAAGLSPRTIVDWTHAAATGTWDAGAPVHPASLPVIQEFIAAVEMARAQHEAELVRRIYAAGEQIINDKTGARDWRANAWVLNNNPSYRDRWHQDHSGPATVVITARPSAELAALSEAELIDLAPEWREILTPRQPAALLTEGKPDAT